MKEEPQEEKRRTTLLEAVQKSARVNGGLQLLLGALHGVSGPVDEQLDLETQSRGSVRKQPAGCGDREGWCRRRSGQILSPPTIQV